MTGQFCLVSNRVTFAASAVMQPMHAFAMSSIKIRQNKTIRADLKATAQIFREDQ